MDQIEKIVWTERGIESLESVIEFIAADSDYYASRFAKRILKFIENLREFPNMGRVVPEFNQPAFRELIYQNYRIVYKIDCQIVYILLVCHGMHEIRSLPEF